MSKFPRPPGSKPRRPEALVKGKEYTLTYVAREKSQYPSRSNEDVYKLIAVYKDFGMLFHTYLPYVFDKKTDEDVAKYNSSIKDKKNVRLVYYGKISRCLEMEILEDGEEVNAEKLEGVALIEATEANASSSGKRKKDEEEHEDLGSSPKKQA